MAKITKKVRERLRAGLRRFKPLLKAARERDASRADTATLALDQLSDLFGFDRYTEVTSELDNREAVYDFAIHSGGSTAMLVRVSPVGDAPDDRYLLATSQHALLNGVEWIVLTNGIGWQVHHVEDIGNTRPETPVVLAFDLSHMQPGRDAHLDYPRRPPAAVQQRNPSDVLLGARPYLRRRREAGQRDELGSVRK